MQENKPVSEINKKITFFHLRKLADKALAARAAGKNAAITFVAYGRWMRDYMRNIIPDIKIIHIKVPIPMLCEKNWIRLSSAME